MDGGDRFDASVNCISLNAAEEKRIEKKEKRWEENWTEPEGRKEEKWNGKGKWAVPRKRKRKRKREKEKPNWAEPRFQEKEKKE